MNESVVLRSVEEIMDEMRGDISFNRKVESDISDSYINIEEIMNEIRQEIREKGYKESDLSFTDIPVSSQVSSFLMLDRKTSDMDTVLEKLVMLASRYNVQPYRPLRSGRVFGLIIVFVKKIIRKLTKFYVEPIVIDQNENNKLMMDCIQDLYVEVKLLQNQLNAIQAGGDNTKL